MKLRNKNTGEIIELDNWLIYTDRPCGTYTSLADVNADWEDYTPQEPLIKDEKIRKAVRAWAEVNGIEEVGVVQYREITTFCDAHTDITFYGNLPGLIDGAEYTIAELCGEEEQ